MAKDRTKIIFISGLLILLAGGFFYYFYYYQPTVNYLIPGVPYNGIQNLYFHKANSPVIASIMDILGYWGDERFSIAELGKKFSQIPSSNQGSLTIEGFFKENGYEVYRKDPLDLGNEIKEIKKFVNSKEKIPVIVFQKRSLDPENPALGPRVVIGVFDKEKKVIVHDNLLGNNYEISYENFEKMFSGNRGAVLAVWPSEKIKGIVKGPNYDSPYPQRTEIMDKLGPLLASEATEATFYRRTGNNEKAVVSYKELVDDPNFKYLPSAFQVSMLSAFASIHIGLKQYDEAIKIINERVLPLNQNLSKAPEGWFVLSVDRFPYPYFVLSLAYLGKGEKNLAIAYYKDYYKEMVPLRDAVIQLNKNFVPPLIDELEKAISSKK